ncbi:MAG: WecB/TagA/CpsF family glycosyltransferase [Methylococcales bacterium]|nr:WecB/TagA/CpsF family glycosyltransferase [Methylococcales bacterium]
MNYDDNALQHDFNRDIWCLHGLPIDNLTLEETIETIHKRIESKTKTVLTTININLLILSLSDQQFRKSILLSELCSIDGVPLLWLAQRIGLPLVEVVQGSTLAEKINQGRHSVSMYFFGGEKATLDKLKEKFSQTQSGINYAGAKDPGFGSVKEQSRPKNIDDINDSKPDFVLVALGANKGQKWIMENKYKINAPIISYLGATIHFLTNTLKRAPENVQKIGLEWVWRILKEPKLFTRYLFDGLGFIKILTNYALASKNLVSEAEVKPYTLIESNGELEIILASHLTLKNKDEIRDIFIESLKKNKTITLNFKQVDYVENKFLGQLLLMIKYQQLNEKKLTLTNLSHKIHKYLKTNGIELSLIALNQPSLQLKE